MNCVCDSKISLVRWGSMVLDSENALKKIKNIFCCRFLDECSSTTVKPCRLSHVAKRSHRSPFAHKNLDFFIFFSWVLRGSACKGDHQQQVMQRRRSAKLQHPEAHPEHPSPCARAWGDPGRSHGCCWCWWVLSPCSPSPSAALEPTAWPGSAPASSLARAEAVKLQGIIFSLVSRGKEAYAIVLSVSAFPPTTLLLTSFEPLVKRTGRAGELRGVKLRHVFTRISSILAMPLPGAGGDAGEGERGKAGGREGTSPLPEIRRGSPVLLCLGRR